MEKHFKKCFTSITPVNCHKCSHKIHSI